MKKSLAVLLIGGMIVGCSNGITLEEDPAKDSTSIEEEAQISIESAEDMTPENLAEMEFLDSQSEELDEQLLFEEMEQVLEEETNK